MKRPGANNFSKARGILRPKLTIFQTVSEHLHGTNGAHREHRPGHAAVHPVLYPQHPHLTLPITSAAPSSPPSLTSSSQPRTGETTPDPGHTNPHTKQHHQQHPFSSPDDDDMYPFAMLDFPDLYTAPLYAYAAPSQKPPPSNYPSPPRAQSSDVASSCFAIATPGPTIHVHPHCNLDTDDEPERAQSCHPPSVKTVVCHVAAMDNGTSLEEQMPPHTSSCPR